MTAQARRVRPDADVYLVDINPAMARQARNHGVPPDRIVVADITDVSLERWAVTHGLEGLFSEPGAEPHRLRARSGSVAHIFSHSVVSFLPRPETFFAEARRLLGPGGTLAVSTVGEDLDRYRPYFIDYVDRHLSEAVRRGLVSSEQRATFVEQNRRRTEVTKTPLSRAQLADLGERHGLVVEVVADCYVVDTPEGPRPYFHQVLYRNG